MLILALSLTAGAAECERSVNPAAIASQIDEAELAWAGQDRESVHEIVLDIRDDLPCVKQPLEPSRAAAIHRVFALDAIHLGQSSKALLSFRAAAAAESSYRMPTTMAPTGSQVERLYSEATSIRPPVIYRMRVDEKDNVWVDGTETQRQATELPSIVQVGRDGKVLWTGYFEGGVEPDPPNLNRWGNLVAQDEPEERPPTRIEEPEEEDGVGMIDLDGPPPKASGGTNGFAVGAVVTGLGAGALFGTSAAVRSGFDDAPTRGKYNTINGAYAASVGLAVVTGALIIGAVAKSSKSTSTSGLALGAQRRGKRRWGLRQR